MNKLISAHYNELYRYGVKNNSLAYVDLDENELCHFKYVKREKLPNGKWRYYYDESELEKAESKVNDAKDKRNKAMGKAINAGLDLDFALEDETTTYDDIVKKEKIYENAKEMATLAQQKVNDAVRKCKLQKIASIPSRALSKAFVAVANAVSNIGKKKNAPTKTIEKKTERKNLSR